MRQNTDHGGRVFPTSPPQMETPVSRPASWAMSADDRLARRRKEEPSPMRQLAESRPLLSAFASPNVAPASLGTISFFRVARSRCTRASRLLPDGGVQVSQSSTPERKVESSSGSGTSSPYFS